MSELHLLSTDLVTAENEFDSNSQKRKEDVLLCFTHWLVKIEGQVRKVEDNVKSMG